jgi:DNA-binding NarL/FixJ family response regulator
MTKKWNFVVEHYTNWEDDGRKTEAKNCKALHDSLIFMWDKIKQTKAEYEKQITDRDEEIRRLKFELSKWTDQQKGRKPALNEEQHKQIKLLRADGESCRSIARKFGVSEKTIRNSLRR